MSNLSDKIIAEFDFALRTLWPPPQRMGRRLSPASLLPEPALLTKEQQQAAALMRVNHAGEICAQALYQGQATSAQLSQIKKQMLEAAAEETDHLAWCEQRLQELNSQPSLLNPLWYLGSFIIGAVAGLAGDAYSLGFVVETERQVSEHLQEHLHLLPIDDLKTQVILKQMQQDETQHAQTALQSGAANLPQVIKNLMRFTAKIMTTTSYYI